MPDERGTQEPRPDWVIPSTSEVDAEIAAARARLVTLRKLRRIVEAHAAAVGQYQRDKGAA